MVRGCHSLSLLGLQDHSQHQPGNWGTQSLLLKGREIKKKTEENETRESHPVSFPQERLRREQTLWSGTLLLVFDPASPHPFLRLPLAVIKWGGGLWDTCILANAPK